MKPEAFQINEAWVVFPLQATPLMLAEGEVTPLFVVDARTQAVIAHAPQRHFKRDQLGPVLVSALSGIALQTGVPKPWPRRLLWAFESSTPREVDAFAAQQGITLQRVTREDVQPIIGAFVANTLSSFDKMKSRLTMEDDEQGHDDEEDETQAHDPSRGAFHGEKDIKDAVLESLEMEIEANDHDDDEPCEPEELAEILNLMDQHECPNCCAALLGCGALDLAVIFAVYSTPEALMEFLEFVPPGANLIGHGVAAVSYVCAALAQSPITPVTMSEGHTLAAVVLLGMAYGRLADGMRAHDNGSYRRADERWSRRVADSAHVLLAIERNDSMSKAIQGLTTLEPDHVNLAVREWMTASTEMGSMSDQLGESLATLLRDTTAATGLAPQAEKMALEVEGLAETFASQMNQWKVSDLFERYFEEAIATQWTVCPMHVRTTLLEERAAGPTSPGEGEGATKH
jgi:hypothetical protein